MIAFSSPVNVATDHSCPSAGAQARVQFTVLFPLGGNQSHSFTRVERSVNKWAGSCTTAFHTYGNYHIYRKEAAMVATVYRFICLQNSKALTLNPLFAGWGIDVWAVVVKRVQTRTRVCQFVQHLIVASTLAAGMKKSPL